MLSVEKNSTMLGPSLLLDLSVQSQPKIQLDLCNMRSGGRGAKLGSMLVEAMKGLERCGMVQKGGQSISFLLLNFQSRAYWGKAMRRKEVMNEPRVTVSHKGNVLLGILSTVSQPLLPASSILSLTDIFPSAPNTLSSLFQPTTL